MKKVIPYARVATTDQSAGENNALQKQLNELKKFCETQKLEIVECYCDVSTGATFNREGFNQLLLDLESGNVKADFLLVTTWDRFSRGLTEALEVIKRLRALGVKVKSLQDFGSNDFDIILKHSGRRKK